MSFWRNQYNYSIDWVPGGLYFFHSLILKLYKKNIFTEYRLSTKTHFYLSLENYA